MRSAASYCRTRSTAFPDATTSPGQNVSRETISVILGLKPKRHQRFGSGSTGADGLIRAKVSRSFTRPYGVFDTFIRL